MFQNIEINNAPLAILTLDRMALQLIEIAEEGSETIFFIIQS